jgi:transposase
MGGWLLTAAQRRRLERELTVAGDAAFFRRAFALLEIDAGRPLEEVAHPLRVSARSLYRWIERYRSHASLEGLRRQPGQGRPLRWDERLEALLPAVLARCPRDFGYLATGWTLPLLQQVLAQGRPDEPTLSEDTLRRRLHERGYVWKRFRYVLDPDPQREKKTLDPPPNSGLARPDGALGPGRNRVAAAAAALAGRLGAEGPTGPGAPQRPKRAAGPLRQPAPADRPRAVSGPSP